MEEINKEQTSSGQETAVKRETNNYEKVIIAAKLSRRINDLRVAAREQLAPEELVNLDQRKVTSVALDELKGGKVRFTRKREEPEEETFDLT